MMRELVLGFGFLLAAAGLAGVQYVQSGAVAPLEAAGPPPGASPPVTVEYSMAGRMRGVSPPVLGVELLVDEWCAGTAPCRFHVPEGASRLRIHVVAESQATFVLRHGDEEHVLEQEGEAHGLVLEGPGAGWYEVRARGVVRDVSFWAIVSIESG